MCENPLKITVNNEEIYVKCRKCPTCQRERAQEWAIKLINESKYHRKACFVTLTFDNKILIKGNKYGANCSFLYHIENSKEYFRKFIKRLRKKYKDNAITYFHTGEYGELTKRTHHHVLLFGIDFRDERIEMEKSKTGHTQYWSKSLSDLWACGRVSIEDVNPSNIMYIAQYSIKKYETNQENKRYKPIFSFSNRSKMSVKYIRRNPEQIINGYLTDADGKRYRIPESYKKELKEKGNEYQKNCFRKYEDKILELMVNNSQSDVIEQQKKKSLILEKRKKMQNTIRDF